MKTCTGPVVARADGSVGCSWAAVETFQDGGDPVNTCPSTDFQAPCKGDTILPLFQFVKSVASNPGKFWNKCNCPVEPPSEWSLINKDYVCVRSKKCDRVDGQTRYVHEYRIHFGDPPRWYSLTFSTHSQSGRRELTVNPYFCMKPVNVPISSPNTCTWVGPTACDATDDAIRMFVAQVWMKPDAFVNTCGPPLLPSYDDVRDPASYRCVSVRTCTRPDGTVRKEYEYEIQISGEPYLLKFSTRFVYGVRNSVNPKYCVKRRTAAAAGTQRPRTMPAQKSKK